jgi:hypothetical protein
MLPKRKTADCQIVSLHHFVTSLPLFTYVNVKNDQRLRGCLEEWNLLVKFSNLNHMSKNQQETFLFQIGTKSGTVHSVVCVAANWFGETNVLFPECVLE